MTVGPDLSYNGGQSDAFVAEVGGCVIVPEGIWLLEMWRQGVDAALVWDPDPGAASGGGYDVWTVTWKGDNSRADILHQPPAMGVVDCSPPSPASLPGCLDAGAIDRPDQFRTFYQVRVFCSFNSEGP